MRNYKHVDMYISTLLNDIYPQPGDKGHATWTRDVIENWVSKLSGCKSVLDVGCGVAYAQYMFANLGIPYTGVCLGKDYLVAKLRNKNVYNYDFNFLPFENGSFDLVFSRHALEHSPMPLISLMEWHRVAKNWLCLVLPDPEYWGWAGQNHYSVMNDIQARYLIARAGWHVIWFEQKNNELRYMCEKDTG
jgi:SAM-dependent methyltransferase